MPVRLHAWRRSDNMAKVGFVYTGEAGGIPIEVKDGANPRANILTVFRRSYQSPPCAVIASHHPVQPDHGVLQLPLYHLARAEDALREMQTR